MNNIKKIRNKIGLSQEGLSKLSAVPMTTIQKLESGANDVNGARYSTIYNISNSLNVPVNSLIDVDNDPFSHNSYNSHYEGMQSNNIKFLYDLFKNNTDTTKIKNNIINYVSYDKWLKHNDWVLDKCVQTLSKDGIADIPVFIKLSIATYSPTSYNYPFSEYFGLIPIRCNFDIPGSKLEEVTFSFVSMLAMIQKHIAVKTVESNCHKKDDHHYKNAMEHFEGDYGKDQLDRIFEQCKLGLSVCGMEDQLNKKDIDACIYAILNNYFNAEMFDYGAEFKFKYKLENCISIYSSESFISGNSGSGRSAKVSVLLSLNRPSNELG